MRGLRFIVLGAGIFASVPGYAQDAASGEKIFVQCKACHQIGENAKNAVGPVLNGLFGRKAGTIEGFSYSPRTKIPESPGMKQLSANTSRTESQDTRHQNDFSRLEGPKQIDDVVAFLKQFDFYGKKEGGDGPRRKKAREAAVAAQSMRPVPSGRVSRSVIHLPRSSACQRSLVEVRPTIPVCTLAGSVGLCVRLGCPVHQTLGAVTQRDKFLVG
jgi:cytochrome c